MFHPHAQLLLPNSVSSLSTTTVPNANASSSVSGNPFASPGVGLNTTAHAVSASSGSLRSSLPPPFSQLNVDPNGLRKLLLTKWGASEEEIRLSGLDARTRNRLEQLKATISDLHVPSLICYEGPKVMHFNSALVESSPYTREQLEAADFHAWNLIAAEHLPQLAHTLYDALDNPKKQSFTTIAQIKSKGFGRAVPAVMTAQIVRLPSGFPYGMMIVVVPLGECLDRWESVVGSSNFASGAESAASTS
jgi:hypothetical protein